MVSPNLVQFWETIYLFSHICPHLQYTTNQVNLLWAPILPSHTETPNKPVLNLK